MIGIFKKTSRANKTYSEENAYFLNIDITDFYDHRTGQKRTLSYQRAYQIGKDLYEAKFGRLVGADLSIIKTNLLQVYSDKTLEEKSDEELDPSDIGNVITYLGKNSWLIHQSWKFFENSYREKFGVPEEIVSDNKLKKFFREYSYDDQNLSKDSSRVVYLNHIKKVIRSYVDDLRSNIYDGEGNYWNDFEITHEFMQVRLLMIDISNPIPAYVWNLIDGNPFYTIYNLCREYMKWKKSLFVYKEVFNNVCRWESGNIFSEDEILSKYEEGLWVNWNKIGNDFLSAKNKIMTLDGGLRWLKEEFSDHIKRRRIFYDQFKPDNNLIFSENIIQSLDNM
jgi:hypothetical protein